MVYHGALLEMTDVCGVSQIEDGQLVRQQARWFCEGDAGIASVRQVMRRAWHVSLWCFNGDAGDYAGHSRAQGGLHERQQEPHQQIAAPPHGRKGPTSAAARAPLVAASLSVLVAGSFLSRVRPLDLVLETLLHCFTRHLK